MEAKDVTDLTNIISQNGFSSLMCIWFMWRMEKRFDRMIKVMTLMAERLKVDAIEEDEGHD